MIGVHPKIVGFDINATALPSTISQHFRQWCDDVYIETMEVESKGIELQSSDNRFQLMTFNKFLGEQKEALLLAQISVKFTDERSQGER